MILHLVSQKGELNDDDDGDDVINLVLRNPPFSPLAFGLAMTTKIKKVPLTTRVYLRSLTTCCFQFSSLCLYFTYLGQQM